MKSFLLYFLLFSLIANGWANSAAASELRFFPKIQNESLAEEAILLLQCLSQKSGDDWVLGEGDSSPAPQEQKDHWLKIDQLSGKIEAQGRYFHEEKEIKFALKIAEAGKVCATIFPENPNPSPSSKEDSLPGSFPESVDSNAFPKKSNKLIWGLASAAALLVGGYLLWKSHQPDHSSMKME